MSPTSRWCSLPSGSSTTSRPTGSTAVARAAERHVAGQFDLDVPADRVEFGHVPIGAVGRQGIEGGEHRAQHGRRRHAIAEPGGALGRPADVQSHADDDRARSSGTLRQDPGQLATVEQDVVRPLEGDRRSSFDQGRRGGADAVDDRQPDPLREGGRHRRDMGEPERHQQVRTGRSLPGPIEPSTTGGLVVRDEHMPVAGGAVVERSEQIGVGAARLGDVPNGPPRWPDAS